MSSPTSARPRLSWRSSAPSGRPRKRWSSTPSTAIAAAASRRRSRPRRSGGHGPGSGVPCSPAVTDTHTTRCPLSGQRPSRRREVRLVVGVCPDGQDRAQLGDRVVGGGRASSSTTVHAVRRSRSRAHCRRGWSPWMEELPSANRSTTAPRANAAWTAASTAGAARLLTRWGVSACPWSSACAIAADMPLSWPGVRRQPV